MHFGRADWHFAPTMRDSGIAVRSRQASKVGCRNLIAFVPDVGCPKLWIAANRK